MSVHHHRVRELQVERLARSLAQQRVVEREEAARLIVRIKDTVKRESKIRRSLQRMMLEIGMQPLTDESRAPLVKTSDGQVWG